MRYRALFARTLSSARLTSFIGRTSTPGCVLAQREMEKKRSRLVVDSAPAGRGFSTHSGLSSDDSYAAGGANRARVKSQVGRSQSRRISPSAFTAWFLPKKSRQDGL